MKTRLPYNYITSWSEKILAQGRYGFGLPELREANEDLSDTAIKFALKRLSDKGKVLSIFKGYYLIIPPQYAIKGILPTQLYLDAFMKHLQRPYYVALLNAAAFHGASHQQPQEFFVMTDFPVLRPTLKKGQKVNYISVKEIPEALIEKRKTETGYLNISNPVLTACDLVQFEKRVGGINRVATVLNELTEVITVSDFLPMLLMHVHLTTLQRLGYLIETVCCNMELADALFEAMTKEKLRLFRIPLKASKETKGYSSENRWKVIVNTNIEIDE
ncbi:MAG: type IV toxin-antitoxin system AbiEi family antitoxin [Bacteroidia bacterium]